MLRDPLVGTAPDHAPFAVQEVAFVADQLNVEAEPLFTVLGLAARLTIGVGAFTETVAVCEAEPPEPVQVITYVVLALRAPVDAVPLIGREPDHPPLALHEVALLADQLSVALAPFATVLGLAFRVTVGA